ncbi:MAG: DnaA N-terminal domain-containing protein, partial [Asticcacaulis sp.]
MPGMTSWSPILPETVWSKVAPVLRRELGEGPFNSYVAPSTVRPGPNGEPVLVTPTAYARDWFTRHAMRRTQELWTQHDPDSRVLDLKSRVDFEREMNAAPMDAKADAPVETPVSATAETVTVTGGNNRVSGLQERLTFDSFVAGRGNEFA